MRSERTRKILSSVFRWETMLVAVLVIMCVVFNRQDAVRQAAGLSKRDVFNLSSVIKGLRPYMLYSFMTLGMMLILAMGDIDISTGATAALSAAVLGVAYQALTRGGVEAGLSLLLSVGACLLTGGLCGAMNGLLVTPVSGAVPHDHHAGDAAVLQGRGLPPAGRRHADVQKRRDV